MNDIGGSLRVVRERILGACRKAGRSAGDVRLIGVTKRVDQERVTSAFRAGLSDFGESYLQEARTKIGSLKIPVSWHMIGHIQTNKLKLVPGLFDYVHTVDRLEVLEGLDRFGKPIPVLFEVNLSGEETKHGTTGEGLRRLLERAAGLKAVQPVGLMTMPPPAEDPEEARSYFIRLRELLAAVNREFGMTMKELSMGMSADFEVAIEEGATMVRVGTAIFGERS